MKYLKIKNNGELDIRLVALMGGTTKSNSKFKIGQFGTGLKYTLAYLFRNNIDFRIFSGDQEIDIGLDYEDINGVNFEIIKIDGHRTSITTQMGLQWDAWMIIRELWCNALDEGGNEQSLIYKEEDIIGNHDETIFYIQINTEIQKVLDNWDSYFIHNNEPIFENEDYAIYHNYQKESLKLYKNGVLIYQHPQTKSLFLYDIKGADINELREFRGIVSLEVFNALCSPNQETISYFLNHIDDKLYEGSELDFDWFKSFGSIWKNTLAEKKITHSGAYRSFSESGGENIDFSNVIELPKKVYSALIKNFEGIGASIITDDDNEFCEIKNTKIELIVKESLSDLINSGYFINQNLSILFGIFSNKTKVCGLSNKRNELMFSDAGQNLSKIEICELIIKYNESYTSKKSLTDIDFINHIIKNYTQKLLNNNKSLNETPRI